MGARALTRALVALAALAPAAVWLAPPASPLIATLVVALAVAAALHGLGRAVGALIGDDDAPPALAVAWGLAAYLALGGWLAAAGVFDDLAQRVVLVAGTAVGAAWTTAHVPATFPRPRARLALLAPALAIAVVAIHLVGAAGWWQASFSDGESHLLGPVARLAATGALDDPFAVPRTSGLGGNVILHSLGGALGDWRMLHAIDRGLGLALVVALAFRAARPGPSRVLALFALVALASGVAEFTSADLAPRWTLVALVFALHQTLARRPSSDAVDAVPALLVAGALGTLRHGGVGALLAVAIVSIADTERGQRRRALAIVAAVAAVVVGGYLVAAWSALAGEPAAPDVVAILRRGAPLRLALWTCAALAAHVVATVAVRAHGDRALTRTIAAVAAMVALAGPLGPSGSAWLTWQPLGIALLLLAIAPLLAAAADRATASPPAAVAVVGLTLAIATLRFPTGRPALSWEDRLVRQLDGARALAHRGADDAERAAYDDALRPLPRGARVGLWVDRPDLVDYRGRSIVDLRSVAATGCTRFIPRFSRRFYRPLRGCRALASLLPRLHLDYLVVAATALPRPDAWRDRPWCQVFTPLDCVDPITRFVGAERRRGAPALDVVDLRAAR